MSEPSVCRQCSECDGDHHWLEHCDDPEDGGSDWCGFVCKHCDARREACDECGGPLSGDGPCAQCGGPYVCPGCYTVGGGACAPGCIDAKIEADRERDREPYLDADDCEDA